MRKIILLVTLLIISTQLHAQKKKDSIPKNFRFSILGGPGYTPDYGFLIGGSALMTFSTDPSDPEMKRSVLPTAFSYIFKGGGSVQVKPQLFFNKDRFRIFGNIYYKNTLDNYYGVGYENNSSIERGENTTQYRSSGYKINPEFLFRIGKTNLFWGAIMDFTQTKITEPAEAMIEDPYYIADGGTEEGKTYFNNGFGIKFFYDTRDVPANAYRGIYLDVGATFYSEILRGNTAFTSINLDYRQYQKLDFISARSVLAWRTLATFTAGDTPITDLASIGSPFDLRGFYKGQYRDKSSGAGIVEYRHMFETDRTNKFKRILSKMGFAAWTGLGFVGGPDTGWSPPLWNYGAGLRIEVQPRMNFRLDYGIDPISKQGLIYFNMTEAF